MDAVGLVLLAVLGCLVCYRVGYRDGHLDGLLERHHHQPVSRHGRKIHRHLSLWREE